MDMFKLVSLIRGVNGDGPDGRCYGPAELIEVMDTDPEWAEIHRSGMEHFWRTGARPATEAWIAVLVQAARYQSDLIGGDVPILVPRDVVEASVGICRAGQADALLIGKAVQRSIASQVAHNAQIHNQALLDEIRRLMGDQNTRAVPPSSRWLSTKDMAARLAIDEVTAARLCKKGLIIADKTASGQWRTTEDRLRRSPYLNGQMRRRRGKNNGKVE